MKPYLISCLIILAGCAQVSEPEVNTNHVLPNANRSEDSGTDASKSAVDSSTVIHIISVDAALDAAHQASIDAGYPEKDTGIDSHVAPKDTGVDSWIAPGSVATGGKCKDQIDCTVGGCDYTGHCIKEISCVLHHGGDTCGAGEDTDFGLNPKPASGEESCCTSVPIAGTNYTLDKYLITAGRMRAFVNKFSGNLRSFTNSIPASNTNWNTSWNAYIPSTIDEVDAQLGPYPAPLTPDPYCPECPGRAATCACGGLGTQDTTDGFPIGYIGQWRLGCDMGTPAKPNGARTWWTNKLMPGDQAPISYPQDYLDDKMLNCVDAYMLSAFCIWDGGHLATIDELSQAWGPNDFPWSYRAPNVSIDSATQMPLGIDANGLDMSHFISHEFGISNQQFITPFTYEYDPYNLFADDSIHIPAPGRFPLGNSVDGISDLVGATYTMSSIVQPTTPIYPPPTIANAEHTGTLGGAGSWEIHPIYAGAGGTVDLTFRPAWWAYWAGGGRCAR